MMTRSRARQPGQLDNAETRHDRSERMLQTVLLVAICWGVAAGALAIATLLH